MCVIITLKVLTEQNYVSQCLQSENQSKDHVLSLTGMTESYQSVKFSLSISGERLSNVKETKS